MVYEGYYRDSDKRLTDTLGTLANDDIRIVCICYTNLTQMNLKQTY